MAYLRLGKLVAIFAFLPAVLALCGCGGVSASHSVSPASFFLPGLMQYEEPQMQSEEWAQTTVFGDKDWRKEFVFDSSDSKWICQVSRND